LDAPAVLRWPEGDSLKQHETQLERVIAALLQQPFFRLAMAAQTVLDEINGGWRGTSLRRGIRT
jgi:hypothetical protein